jgi:uncharacterized protein (UPF0332 family)
MVFSDSFYSKFAYDAFDDRGLSDYEDYYEAMLDEAEQNIEHAQKFISTMECYIADRIKLELIEEDEGDDDLEFDEGENK